MVRFTNEHLCELFAEFKKKNIMVIGDIMLDRYVWGRVSRISPEAPVPVVEIESESYRFGGAANVAYNVKTLGANVFPIGVIGKDGSGEILKKFLEENDLPTDGIIIDKERPTTVKTRVIAHNQHVVRTDRELRKGISIKVQGQILDLIRLHLNGVDGIIIEDYNKGLLVSRFISDLIELALSKDKMIFVDPKFDNFFNYQKVTLFKPNLKEVADKLGVRIDSDEALNRAGRKLMSRLECKALMITLGDEGMILFERDSGEIKIPTHAMKVHDVSGAGDTVIATMAVAMTSGSSLLEAATIANHAAGIVCGEVGIKPVDRDQLLRVLKSEGDN